MGYNTNKLNKFGLKIEYYYYHYNKLSQNPIREQKDQKKREK